MTAIVRLSEERDIDGLFELAKNAGTGMTTVPNSREAIEARVTASIKAQASEERAGPKDVFFFVLEMDGEVVGMASIFPALGEDRPFYSYRMSKVAAAAPELGIQASSDLLYLCNDYHGYAEIGTLLVSDKARGTGAGRLLSLSRFLFMKAIEDRISENVMAEIRGRFDDSGKSPFWDAIAAKFFDMTFEEADRRSAHDFRFIADLMPKFPIYTNLLSEEAQEVLGKPHKDSAPAMNMLMAEGFTFQNCIDIFDAGPSLEAPLNLIRTVREAERAVVRVLDNIPTQGERRCIVAVPDAKRFRAILMERGPSDGSMFLTPQEADMLQVSSSDKVVCSPLKTRKGSR
ncbi:arginine N-succinyltransferase [Parvularcula lutaonensis]|uniref:Arginine N-succinyltransferase n=1 Tax=Parvularcula lutaonensis TaxID=491923 RepID=A0ABV7MDT2_9PROT|nr:arginine N-succinyltransferase [Parvularcula lutaonensis]GGY53322.1 arginine N-succinyltransferase subunit beta [Parvularcula lutaonensis]